MCFCIFFLVLQLINGEGEWLLDNYNVNIIPVVNPDGYIYTYKKNGVRSSVEWFGAIGIAITKKNRKCEVHGP